MFKNIISLGAWLLLFAGVATAADTAMTEFTSPDGQCSVQFPSPGTPTTARDVMNLNGGVTTPMYEFYVENGKNTISYMLMYNDYPSNYSLTLKQTRDVAIAGKKLLSDKAIRLNGVPGRAFTFQDKDGWNYSVRHYIVGKRLYQLIVVTGPGLKADALSAFMNSFVIK